MKKPNLATHFEVDAESEDSVGANEDTVFIRGEVIPAEPEVGLYKDWFEIHDIVNSEGVSVMDRIEDEDWLLRVRDSILDSIEMRCNS
jgi:hypothetical protein